MKIAPLIGFKAPKNCNVLNCTNRAAYEVGALVWAQGFRKGSHEPLALQADLYVCEAHKGFPKVKNLFTPKGQERICAELVKAGRKPPDFTTAEILLAPIGGSKIQIH